MKSFIIFIAVGALVVNLIFAAIYYGGQFLANQPSWVLFTLLGIVLGGYVWTAYGSIKDKI